MGKYLVRKIGKTEIALPITEVEAYFGFEDEGSHAFRGETTRTKVMFGEAGHFYIYLIYGMYEMLNIVVDKEKFPAALLIRGVEGYSGPGKLTKFLRIDRKLNNTKASKESGLWIEDRGLRPKDKEILKTPRIGISYASPKWQKKPYRFVWKKPN